MRILFAVPDYRDNPFAPELAESIRSLGHEVVYDSLAFWSCDGSFDVVHLHWPEGGYGERQAQTPEAAFIMQHLYPHWKRESALVVTRHDARPHNKDPIGTRLINATYETVHGMIHMGHVSRDEIVAAGICPEAVHGVIPHAIYSSYGADISKHDARARLGLKKHHRVALGFGKFRHKQEAEYVLAGFANVRLPGRILLAPQMRSNARPSRSRHLGAWLKWEHVHHQYLYPRRIMIDQGWIADRHVPVLFAASDVAVIQRLDTLNSGIVPLALQSGLVTVGTSGGTIGELLRETGNPTFDPQDPNTLTTALESAFQAADQGLGTANATYAQTHWNPKRVAELHVKFYEDVIKKTKRSS